MKSAQFKVDAALLRELGERLIGQPHIALAELLKNSYDADATNCGVEFRDDEIVVLDDGQGMSEREFHDYWMRIGTTHKTQQRESRRFRRPMTGSKGIGRLSAQFLADEMILESATVEDPGRYLYAIVDWSQVQRGQDIETVNVLWEMRDRQSGVPFSQESGTRIVARKLRTEWDEDEIEDLGREVWVLRSPFRPSTARPAGASAQDFAIDIEAPGILKAREAFDKLHDALFANWRAKIRGLLRNGRAGGQAVLTVDFKSGYPNHSERARTFRETVTLPVSGNLGDARAAPALDRAEFEILIFKTEGRQPGGVPVTEMREYLRRFGNVSVYDSGFRLPYYGASQDWLNVALDQGRRLVASELLPARLNVEGHLLDLPAPGRIFGAVDIDTNREWRAAGRDAEPTPGTFLQLQPGRDRLADNAAFKQLRRLVRFSLDFYASRHRLLASQIAEERRAVEKPSRTFRRALVTLDRNKDSIPPAVYREARSEVAAAERASRRNEEDLDHRAALLAPLATAGMSAVAMHHELAREIRLVRQIARRLKEFAESLGTSRLDRVAEDLLESSRRLVRLRGLFAPLASNEDREARARLKVAAVVESAVRAMGPLMPEIKVATDGLPLDLRFPFGSLAEWNAVIHNLLANGWNATLDAETRSIAVDGGVRGRGREWMRVSDTGVGLGVSLEQAVELFEPFKRDLRVSPENRSLMIGGQGMGLAMVRMIAARRSARAAFVRPRPGFSTSIEISWKGMSR